MGNPDMMRAHKFKQLLRHAGFTSMPSPPVWAHCIGQLSEPFEASFAGLTMHAPASPRRHLSEPFDDNPFARRLPPFDQESPFDVAPRSVPSPSLRVKAPLLNVNAGLARFGPLADGSQRTTLPPRQTPSGLVRAYSEPAVGAFIEHGLDEGRVRVPPQFAASALYGHQRTTPPRQVPSGLVAACPEPAVDAFTEYERHEGCVHMSPRFAASPVFGRRPAAPYSGAVTHALVDAHDVHVKEAGRQPAPLDPIARRSLQREPSIWFPMTDRSSNGGVDGWHAAPRHDHWRHPWSSPIDALHGRSGLSSNEAPFNLYAPAPTVVVRPPGPLLAGLYEPLPTTDQIRPLTPGFVFMEMQRAAATALPMLASA